MNLRLGYIIAIRQARVRVVVTLHVCCNVSDIDECAVQNGGCQKDCLNTDGSYACSCPFGYLIQANGKDCVGMYAKSPAILGITTSRFLYSWVINIPLRLCSFRIGQVLP